MNLTNFEFFGKHANSIVNEHISGSGFSFLYDCIELWNHFQSVYSASHHNFNNFFFHSENCTKTFFYRFKLIVGKIASIVYQCFNPHLPNQFKKLSYLMNLSLLSCFWFSSVSSKQLRLSLILLPYLTAKSIIWHKRLRYYDKCDG